MNIKAQSFGQPTARNMMKGAADRDLVCFQSVRKSYDGIHFVVKDLNLSVREGEFLTMLGPSGSGKTTTLMMLAGFERPTLGRILLDGKPVEQLPPEKRNIGMVFQNYALFPHMTVDENIAFPLRYRGVKGMEARDRIRKARSMVHLDAMADRKPGQLSGGQQQRVALARALVFEPSLVLMDEPLGALDKQLREHMQMEIKQIQTSLGITMVYVTHDQSEALTMSDRIAVFHAGVIQQLADPATLYNAPENNFVAGFIGENNAIVCDVQERGPMTVVKAQDGTLMKCVAPDHCNDGKDLRLMIRPEKLRLAGAEPEGRSNVFSGQIREAFFLGDHLRLRVSALGQDNISIRLNASDGLSFYPGDTVGLACNANDCLLLRG
ncbi:ABC transporter ATP-binding protein [Pseudaminobacter sp. NGMCC 1.201702]|uniref:ABC transporter ATP-binding protein n=1 Tax=Pseudaminobacter sp. NGMCC 1.201702 TaxID=3391825 RepID=UPI0039F02A79